MKVKVTLSNGIVDGDSKRFIEAHLNTDVIEFRQRKTYDEYYYKTNDFWEVDLFILEELAKNFGQLYIHCGELEIII